MAKGKIIVGTSGWNYGHWKGTFYPGDLPVKDWLKYYYEHFNSVELNTSFYHLPKRKTFENWKDAVPAEFVFTVKASRYITHLKKLSEPEESLNKLLDNARGLEYKLGPVLFQLPPGKDLTFKLRLSIHGKISDLILIPCNTSILTHGSGEFSNHLSNPLFGFTKSILFYSGFIIFTIKIY